MRFLTYLATLIPFGSMCVLACSGVTDQFENDSREGASGGDTSLQASSGGTLGDDSVGGSGGDAVTSTGGNTGGGNGGERLEVLGGICDAVGSLGCSGSHQKLRLVCGADNRWQANGTCESGEFCDTRLGLDKGLCAEEHAGCRDHEPGYSWCSDYSVLHQCNVDNVYVDEQTCLGVCDVDHCDDSRPACPALPFVDCQGDCSASSPTSCATENEEGACTLHVPWVDSSQRPTIRSPKASFSCEIAGKEAFRLSENSPFYDSSHVLVKSQSSEWTVWLGVEAHLDSSGTGAASGGEPVEKPHEWLEGSDCVVFDPTKNHHAVWLVPVNENAEVAHFTLENVSADTTCD